MTEQFQSDLDKTNPDFDGQPQPNAAGHGLFCYVCGYRVPANSYFCPKCGHYLYKSGQISGAIPDGRQKCEQLRKNTQ